MKAPMILGTVQLGMNYGIANTDGKPSEETSFAILQAALAGGVRGLDTARAYGDSELVIGRFLKQYKGKRPAVTTKIPRLGEGSAEKQVIASVEASLERLGLPSVSGVMLHAAGDLLARGNEVVSALEELVKRGYTEKIGVSVYTAEEIDELCRYDSLNVTQLPMSIFDQRLIRSGHVEKLAERGVEIYVRSVFLQGLFFLDPEKVADSILQEAALPHLRGLRSLAEREGISVAELAIAYLRDFPGISGLVLGADTPAHVKQNLSYFETPPLSAGAGEEIRERFAQVDIPLIMQVLSRPKA